MDIYHRFCTINFFKVIFFIVSNTFLYHNLNVDLPMASYISLGYLVGGVMSKILRNIHHLGYWITIKQIGTHKELALAVNVDTKSKSYDGTYSKCRRKF